MNVWKRCELDERRDRFLLAMVDRRMRNQCYPPYSATTNQINREHPQSTLYEHDWGTIRITDTPAGPEFVERCERCGARRRMFQGKMVNSEPVPLSIDCKTGKRSGF